MSSPPAVRIRGLTVEAQRKRLLGPLDLDVQRGEHVLLVGASGAGKTTLLRAIAGLARPSSGSIALAGEPVSDGPELLVPPEQRRIGFLFQGGGLWPHMSVTRTLRFVLKHSGRGGNDVRVRDLVRRCRLDGLEDRLPGTLSGGEKQRLALARAIACEPELLLLDEPLGPLDAELRLDLLRLLTDLHAELGWTTIHVTHDPGESLELASRVLCMRGGLFVEDQQVTTSPSRTRGFGRTGKTDNGGKAR